jgi:glycosyltransferase involved in cell wall biosynthesis
VIHAPLPPPIGDGSPPRRPPQTLGFAGRLVAHKGVELLLAAAPALAEIGLRLRIAGHGELEGAVRASPDVDYAGPLASAELGAFMSSCDLGLVPSLWEEPGLTYALLEWHAAGRPVLATTRGGLAEAAPLGGVEPFDGTPEGLVSTARALLGEGGFEALAASVPRPTGQEQSDWLELHLSAYEAALAAGPG